MIEGPAATAPPVIEPNPPSLLKEVEEPSGAWERRLDLGAIANGVKVHHLIDGGTTRIVLELFEQATEDALRAAWKVVEPLIREDLRSWSGPNSFWAREDFYFQLWNEKQQGKTYSQLAAQINGTIVSHIVEYIRNKDSPFSAPFWIPSTYTASDSDKREEAIMINLVWLRELFRIEPSKVDLERVKEEKRLGSLLQADFYLRWMRPRLTLDERSEINQEIFDAIENDAPCEPDYPIHADDVKARLRHFEKQKRKWLKRRIG